VYGRLGAAADVDRLAGAALDDALALPDVVRAGLAITEGGGRRLRFTARAESGESTAWCHIDAYDDVPLTTVVRTGEPVAGSLDELEDAYPGVVARQRSASVAAMAAIPLPGSGSPVGGMILFYDQPQVFDAAHHRSLAARAEAVADAWREARTNAPRRGERITDDAAPGAQVASAQVEADPRAVGDARRFLRRTLRDWEVDDDTSDSAVLCLSEVVTNAIVHTGQPSEVRVLLEDGVLTVSVRDQGVGYTSGPVDSDPLRVHGRGLELVDALTARWGSEVDQVGMTVWFVFES
jgi:anti-sigma regulatory factor (Ser/Thr protein kinase)